MGAHMDGHNTFLRRLDHPKHGSLMKSVFKLQKQGLVRAVPASGHLSSSVLS